LSINTVGSDQFNSVLPKLTIQRVAVISIVTYQILRGVRDDYLDKRVGSQLHFMGCSTFDGDGNGETMTVRNRHDFGSFAAFCLPDLKTPFFAGAKLASINASRTSMPPLALSFKARAVMIFVITPERIHC